MIKKRFIRKISIQKHKKIYNFRIKVLCICDIYLDDSISGYEIGLMK